VAVGIVAEPFTHWFSGFVTDSPALLKASGGRTGEHHLNWPLIAASTAAALLGVGLAYYLYMARPGTADRVAGTARTPYYLSRNKLYVDEVYNVLFVQPLSLLAGVCRLIETVVYDLVRLIAMLPRYVGEGFRWAQNGLVQYYALAMVLGAAGFLGWLVLSAK
jgi:NADH:ubiquinone oxidoreductase subunit 5 (subunit L)/multisubunit Na+/H+ antiporter MnhA subunit